MHVHKELSAAEWVFFLSFLFPLTSIMKISQETRWVVMTFGEHCVFASLACSFVKCPATRLTPILFLRLWAMWLSNCNALRACRSILCVNNLLLAEKGNERKSSAVKRMMMTMAKEGSKLLRVIINFIKVAIISLNITYANIIVLMNLHPLVKRPTET